MQDNNNSAPAASEKKPALTLRLRNWFLERSGFAILNAFGDKQLAKAVPTRLSWLYTTGALAMFYFGLQILTGCLLLTVYVPDESRAYQSVQVIEQQANLGWLIRQCHSWGASFIVIVLGLHIFKVLWNGTYKRPREFTWFVGCILFALTLGFCFSGYLLPWDQLSFWATRVGIEAMESLPVLGPHLKTFVCGSEEVSGATLGRFFALHVFVLPALLMVFVSWHLALITWKGLSPKTSVPDELELGNIGALRKGGSESFFPRQVYRDLIACTIGFALLVTIATFYPLHLHPPADKFQTPEGIKPEWYFLPAYQFLKYFDDNLYNALPFLKTMKIAPDFLGVMTINVICVVLFLLPILDRGKERKMRKRPVFAVFALLLLVGVVGMGVLGFLSERDNVEIFGKYYHFDTKGAWTVTDGPIDDESAGDAKTEGAKTDDAKADDAKTDDAKTEDAKTDDAKTDDAKTEDAKTEDAKTEDAKTEDAETDDAETDDAETDDVETDDAETDDAETDDAETDDAETDDATAASSRAQLSEAGTCVSCHYHDDQHEEWAGSVHHSHDISCADCHGGNKTPAPEKLLGLLEATIENEDAEWPEDIESETQKRLYLWAHSGILLNRKGEPATPRSKAVPEFCGQCHEQEAKLWSSAKVEHEKNCVRCHSNHEVKPVGEFLYTEDGYTEAGEATTTAFQAIRAEFLAFDADLAKCKVLLDELEKQGYPIDGTVQEKQRYERIVDKVKKELRPMIHGLDHDAVKAKTAALREPLQELTESMQSIVDSRDDRWIFVAGAWGFAALFTLLFVLKLRSIGPPPKPEGAGNGGTGGSDGSGSTDDISGVTTERDALLKPLPGGDPTAG